MGRRFSIKRVLAVAGGIAAFTAFMATLPSAIDVSRDVAGYASDIFESDEQPSTADRVVDEYVTFTARRALPWDRPPTVYEPSVVFFKENFPLLDPRRQHGFIPVPPRQAVSVTELADNGPLYAGRLVLVRGRLLAKTIVATEATAVSWAFQIRQPGVRDAGLLCRVPWDSALKPNYVPGDTVLAEGLVLAHGSAERDDGRGSDRVVYMACVSVARPGKAA